MPEDPADRADAERRGNRVSDRRRNAVQVTVVLGIGLIATWSQSDWLTHEFGTSLTACLLAAWIILFTLAVWRITHV